MSRIRVVVTAEDIAAPSGFTDGTFWCPIKRALVRDYPDTEPTVGFKVWTPNRGGRGFIMSRAARRFVRAFDIGKPVQPATFYLEGPDA